MFDEENDDENLAEDVLQDLNEPGSDSELDWAIQRIEEANLFRHLVKNNVFNQNSAAPHIVDSVNARIQKFAMDQLKMLLGGEQAKEAPVKVELPFSESEIEALKKLAARVVEKMGANSSDTERTPTMKPIEVSTNKINANQINTNTVKVNTENLNPVKAQAKPVKKAPVKDLSKLTPEEASKERIRQRNAKPKPKSPVAPLAPPSNDSWAAKQSASSLNQAEGLLKTIVGLEMALPATVNKSEGHDAAIEFDPDNQ